MARSQVSVANRAPPASRTATRLRQRARPPLDFADPDGWAALHTYPSLDRLLGAEVWVKHENHQPIGAFKVRGGVGVQAAAAPAG